MTKGSIIKKVLGTELEKDGFRYTGYKYRMWTFEKQVDDDVTHSIIVYKSEWGKDLRLEFHTSSCGWITTGITDSPNMAMEFYSYETEEDFRKVIEGFVKIIKDYHVVEKLNDYNKSQRVYLFTDEMLEDVYRNREAYYKEVVQANRETFVCSRDVLLYVEDTLAGIWDMPFEQAKPQLVKMAAFLGEYARHILGGEWGKDVHNRYCVKEMDELTVMSPDDYIEYMWENHSCGPLRSLRDEDDAFDWYGGGFADDAVIQEKLCRPTRLRHLYEEHKALSVEYSKRLGIGEDTPLLEALRLVYRRVEQIRNVPFAEAEEELIGLAAVYGQRICDLAQAEWNWDEEKQSCYIREVGMIFYVFESVLDEYRQEHDKDFMRGLDFIIKKYNRYCEASNKFYGRNRTIDLDAIMREEI